MISKDYLEGNEAAQACRERYREIVHALGEDRDRFVVRFEVKVLEGGGATIIATSSRGSDVDREMCELAVTLIQALTAVQIKPDASPNESEEPK